MQNTKEARTDVFRAKIKGGLVWLMNLKIKKQKGKKWLVIFEDFFRGGN